MSQFLTEKQLILQQQLVAYFITLRVQREKEGGG
jgi:hypothetical protein